MEFDVSKLFLEVFGIKVSKAYNPEFGNGLPNLPKLDYSSIEMIDEEEATKFSYLGTPIIYPIKFIGQKYKELNNAGEVVLKRMQTFRLPTTSIVDFDRDKIIGKTKINNNPGGTVKETYGFGDWRITIRGFCLYDPYQEQALFSAIDQEEELMQWDNLIDSIKVSGKLFNIRGINNIVIEKIPVKTLRGKPGIRPFVIHALSDEPLELIL